MADISYFTPYIILPVLSVGVCASLALLAHRSRHLPVAAPISWMMFILSGWALSYALNTSAATLPLKVFFYQTGTTFAAFTGPTILTVALEATGLGEWLSGRKRALFCAVPVLIIFLV